jgi:hypothetical protein
MNWRRAGYGFGAGGLGFVAIRLAMILAIVVSLQSNWLAFGSSPTLSPGQLFIVFVVSPAIACFGPVLISRALGATWRRSLISGVAALIVGLGVLAALSSNYSSYSPFDYHDTLTFVCLVAATVFLGTIGRAETDPTGLTVTIGVAILLIVLVFVLREQGFIVSLFSWLLLPAVAGLFQKT